MSSPDSKTGETIPLNLIMNFSFGSLGGNFTPSYEFEFTTAMLCVKVTFLSQKPISFLHRLKLIFMHHEGVCPQLNQIKHFIFNLFIFFSKALLREITSSIRSSLEDSIFDKNPTFCLFYEMKRLISFLGGEIREENTRLSSLSSASMKSFLAIS